MRNLTFKGTHKDIGEQLGELYKSWGRTDFAMPPYGEEHFQVTAYIKTLSCALS